MTRTVRGTRQGDGPHELVNRRLSIPIALGTALGWLAFAVAAVKCVLSLPHP